MTQEELRIYMPYDLGCGSKATVSFERTKKDLDRDVSSLAVAKSFSKFYCGKFSVNGHSREKRSKRATHDERSS